MLSKEMGISLYEKYPEYECAIITLEIDLNEQIVSNDKSKI